METMVHIYRTMLVLHYVEKQMGKKKGVGEKSTGNWMRIAVF